MMRLVFYTILICALTDFLPATAQLNPNNLTSYSEMEGVDVFDILEDKLGYIWLATQNGLVRYDGYDFKRHYYNPNDSATIQSIVIWSLHEDRKGHLWIGCLENLYRYDPVTESFKQYEYQHLMDRSVFANSGIQTISEDNEGRIYFGVASNFGFTIPNALAYYDEKEDKIKPFESSDGISVQNIGSLLTDKDGTLWISSTSGFLRLSPEKVLSKIELPSTVEHVGSHPFTFKLASDKKGMIWFTTENSSLYSFDPRTKSFTQHSLKGILGSDNKPMVASPIAIDSTDNIWLGSENGLIYFDRNKEKFEVFSEESTKKIERALIYTMRFDSFGNLWMGAASIGLVKYENRAILKSYGHIRGDQKSLLPGWVNHIIEGSDGKIWIANSEQSGGINVMDPVTRSITSFPYRTILPGIWGIDGMTEYSPGKFYLSTAGRGQQQYLSKPNLASQISLPGIPDSTIIYKFYTYKGDDWLCTRYGLFKRKNGQGDYVRYDLASLPGSNLISNQIRNAIGSEKHGLWLLTDNGLFLYNYKTDNFERHGYDKKSGDVFATQDINSFYEDSTGIAWIGTWQGGLSRYDVEHRKIKSYTTTDGLPSMSIQAILADEKNNALWLSTFDGLSRFNIKTGQFNNFSLADGIQGQLFADGACLKTSGGLFIFGGSNGITVFNPEEITKNSVPPKYSLPG